MIKGYAGEMQSSIGIGTHLGTFSEEDSMAYIEAVEYAVNHGIRCIDTAINYRGMRSEKDVGIALDKLISSGKCKREEIFVASKAGLLFGDITTGLRPQEYLKKVLEPEGITIDDFQETEGLYQTLNPRFYAIALDTSLHNLGLETLDVHYIHIPEISRAGLGEQNFYDKMRSLFAWYEQMVECGKLRHYGIALEMLCMEPDEERWYFSIEKLWGIADEVGRGDSHFKYIELPYSLDVPFASICKNQVVNGESCALIDGARKLGLHVVGSMPFAAGGGFKKYAMEQMLSYALQGVDCVNVGSKNIVHIREILETASLQPLIYR
ncbi:MAG: aldo/keto reductase [Roseburia sp.]